MGAADAARPWWREPFGLPPALERMMIDRRDRDLTRFEVASHRLSLFLFPATAVLFARRGSWAGISGILVMVQSLAMLSPHQRRQVFGRHRTRNPIAPSTPN